MMDNDAAPRIPFDLSRSPWLNDKATIEQRLEIYETFRRYVQHEDSLINNRLSWMLTIHGFLYAAYAISLIAQQDTLTSLAAMSRQPDAVFVAAIATKYQLTMVFTFLISSVGLGISALGGISIFAAIQSIRSVARIFRIQSRTYKFNGQKMARHQKLKPLPLRELGVPMMYGTPDGVFLPRMSGGGSRQIAFWGSFAAWMIPAVLAGVWVVSLAVALGHQVDINTLYPAAAAPSGAPAWFSASGQIAFGVR